MSTLLTHALIMALGFTESGGHDGAVNRDAVGFLQIRPIVIEDVNRIYRTDFSLEDRWNRTKSITICELYLKHYCGLDATEMTYALCWRRGPTCAPMDWPYWTQVKHHLDQARLLVGDTATTHHRRSIGGQSTEAKSPNQE